MTDAPPPMLRRKTQPVVAFAALTQASLVRIDTSLQHLLHRDEAEDLHQLRVAVRHARAVLWALGRALPRLEREHWKRELRTLAHATSAVRDWDVFLAETVVPARKKEPEDPVLASVADTAAKQRNTARAAMLAALVSYRDGQLPVVQRDLAHLGHLAEKVAAQGKTRRRDRLGPFARQRVRRGRKRLRALKQAAHGGDPGAVHEQRIAGKRLRYTIEALAPVLPSRFTKRLHRKLVRQQSRLGGFVDAMVARRLMRECLGVPELPDDVPPPPPGAS
ncbi:CHAD domain-containing protein [Cupriavidus consociatus]|uniref:CHAD domain-containing protein n=1 Tax=Cupriavidus consociatus TaxID=2821357 RepID=UPI001AE9460C|nr:MULTISPECIES: CHAD domain-containing protein [unclassified Cupriavidus]MBP0621981.1 CHAD domain-containing protein [Cupriavidus sp. LEh25]MDK2658656.1 CHAD domain-containing protein [Cupriavidus sp. LEh21]